MIPSISSARADSAAASSPGSAARAGGPEPLRRILRDLPGQQAEQAGDVPAAPHRDVQRQHRVAERFAAGGQDAVVISPGMVQPGDDQGAGNSQVLAFLPDGGGAGVHPVHGGDGEQDGVRGAQARAEFADEVRITGRIQEVDLHARHGQRHHRQRHGALLVDGGGIGIAHCGAVNHRALPRDHPVGLKQRLDEGGLAGTGSANECHIPDQGGIGGRDAGGAAALASLRPAPACCVLGAFDRHPNLLASLPGCVTGRCC
jgi:hypothetical protein